MLSARFRGLYDRVPKQLYQKLESFDRKTLEYLKGLILPMNFQIDFYGGWLINRGRVFIKAHKFPQQMIRPYLVNYNSNLDIYRCALKQGNVLQSYKQPVMSPNFMTESKAPRILEIIIDPEGVKEKMVYERIKNVCKFYNPFFRELWFDIKRPVYKDGVMFGFNIKRFRKLDFALLELTNMRITTFREEQENV